MRPSTPHATRAPELCLPPMPAGKRLFDILFSMIGLILLMPLFAIVALAIHIDSPGPIFFRQLRVGRGGRLFRIVKFRSMTHCAARHGPSFTTAGDLRITRIGAILRAAKIDELPQLFNVLMGEMSFVGPRPEVPDLFADYTEAEQAAFFALRPGITDYASLLFCDEARLLAQAADPAAFYRQRLMPIKHELCLRYRAEMSVATDIRIIAATLASMLWHRVPAGLIEPRVFEQTAGFPAASTITASPPHGDGRRASL